MVGLERAVARLRELEPGAAAVIVTGSYAKGTADASSDLDLTAIIREPPRARYRMWFDGDLHVSVSAKTAEEWLARSRQPAGWSRALGFPVVIDAAYLTTDEDVRALLGDPPTYVHPAGDPELEDFVENTLKVRRAAAAGDVAGARWHAHAAAMLAPRLVLGVNEPRVVHDRRDALEAALSLAVAPDGWRDDLGVSLGVADGDAAESALRLARRLLAFLREHDPEVDPQPDIARYLRSGTLERLLD